MQLVDCHVKQVVGLDGPLIESGMFLFFWGGVKSSNRCKADHFVFPISDIFSNVISKV